MEIESAYAQRKVSLSARLYRHTVSLRDRLPMCRVVEAHRCAVSQVARIASRPTLSYHYGKKGGDVRIKSRYLPPLAAQFFCWGGYCARRNRREKGGGEFPLSQWSRRRNGQQRDSRATSTHCDVQEWSVTAAARASFMDPGSRLFIVRRRRGLRMMARRTQIMIYRAIYNARGGHAHMHARGTYYTSGQN